MLAPGLRYSTAIGEIHRGRLQAHLVETLHWTLSHLTNLRAVVCLGQDAWQITHALLDSNRRHDFAYFREQGRPSECKLDGRDILVTAHYHPAARVSHHVRETGWKDLADCLERKT